MTVELLDKSYHAARVCIIHDNVMGGYHPRLSHCDSLTCRTGSSILQKLWCPRVTRLSAEHLRFVPRIPGSPLEAPVPEAAMMFTSAPLYQVHRCNSVMPCSSILLVYAISCKKTTKISWCTYTKRVCRFLLTDRPIIGEFQALMLRG